MSIASQTSAEIAYGVGYAGEQHSNITESALNAQQGAINTVIAGGVYTEKSSTLAAHALVQGEWSRYANNAYSDTPVYFVDTAAAWSIIPDRFTWSLTAVRDQSVIDPLLPVTPENLSESSVYETGPDITFVAGAGNNVALAGRFGQLRYDQTESAFDNDRMLLSAHLQHAVDPVTTLSLNYEVRGIDFTNSNLPGSDYRLSHFYVRATLTPLPTRLELDLGSTQLTRDGGYDTNVRLARLAWTRNITTRSSVGVTAGIELQDAGSVLLAAATNPSTAPAASAPAARSTVTADVFLDKYQEAFMDYSTALWSAKASAFHRRLDYQLVTNSDRSESGGKVELTYGDDLSATTFFAQQSKSRYSTLAREDTDSSGGVRWFYRATHALGFDARGVVVKRTSSETLVGFNDQYVALSIYYSTGASYTPLRR